MLGSRFDLAETLASIAEARAAAEQDNVTISIESAEHFVPAHETPDVDREQTEADQGLIELSCVDLERELVEMAHQVHQRTSRIRFNCPVCDSVMDVCAAEHLPEFGALDIQLHRLACDHCGMLTGRAFHPDVGYQALHR